ncbi:hypothetical protein I79_025156 [Cricetulus griseus]|uniref:Uncharacterized protein n=1 Tax=Cricetulus griseus TaxID=10029 RepID=G3IML6_CRIGR|nr:hypothetical protein I79_025156 [Cricetulus griseus]
MTWSSLQGVKGASPVLTETETHDASLRRHKTSCGWPTTPRVGCSLDSGSSRLPSLRYSPISRCQNRGSEMGVIHQSPPNPPAKR